MAWSLFITASAVSIKQINKALISLEDYENDCDPSWTILYNATHLDSDTHDLDQPSIPPLNFDGAETLDASNNAFAGKTPDEIYNFIKAHEDKLGAKGLTNGDWLIIDERGFETETCLVCVENDIEEDDDDDDDDVQKDRSSFLMARLPWVEAWSMFANLDIANMGFDEWVDEEKGKDVDGEYTWVGPFSESGNEDEEAVEKREEALKEARKKGLVD